MKNHCSDELASDNTEASVDDELASLTGNARGHAAAQPSLLDWISAVMITPSTLRAAALSLICPYVCSALGVLGRDFDPSLVSLLVATPAAFSISAAHQRRENALRDLAELRAWCLCLHGAFGQYSRNAEPGQHALSELYCAFSRHLYTGDANALDDTYRHLQNVASATEALRIGAQPDLRANVGDVFGHCLFLHRSLVRVIECLRLVRSFRTPASLRTFLAAASAVFPVLFAPYFAHIAAEDASGYGTMHAAHDHAVGCLISGRASCAPRVHFHAGTRGRLTCSRCSTPSPSLPSSTSRRRAARTWSHPAAMRHARIHAPLAPSLLRPRRM